MRTEINEIPVMTIQEFAEKHGLTMEINERKVPEADPRRYYAQFKGSELKRDGVLIGTYGDGNSPDEAIKEYVKEIELQTLVFGAYTDNRKEIEVPRLRKGE